ncbi:hypothetical protein CDL15_Pgr012230 [Punica granatum]|uniref:Uncharacterized protein n=1 Tax=Punica granatum TaxID=22663 RepID=A0A218XMF9_PUNGR|nr:hypothetical protein CDL15_Pgr012230 [Punica granatum]
MRPSGVREIVRSSSSAQLSKSRTYAPEPSLPTAVALLSSQASVTEPHAPARSRHVDGSRSPTVLCSRWIAPEGMRT